ncbi:MAG: YihY/virulence factor BrkB family protein [Chloroflexia bacterium]|nr:YihY/virulence factor BrkB family protein [Chloroflexia bacterium]
MIRLQGATGGRLGTGSAPAATRRRRFRQIAPHSVATRRSVRSVISAVPGWMIRGYQQSNAGDLAAAIAFNGMVILVPTFFLFIALAGLFLKRDENFLTALYASFWGLPPGAAQEALENAIIARNNSGWFGALSLIGFAWVGTSFVSCLARSMNRIYAVRNAGYVNEKQRGFFVMLIFAALFLMTLLSSTVPSFFIATDLPVYFELWALAAAKWQFAGYAVALVSAFLLFATIYRVVPNAGQHVLDVWPGAMTAAVLFVLMAQVFPLYIRLLGGTNKYGQALGLVSLMVAWFYVLAHVILFSTYINATYQRHRRKRQRRKRAARRTEDRG